MVDIEKKLSCLSAYWKTAAAEECAVSAQMMKRIVERPPAGKGSEGNGDLGPGRYGPLI